MNVTFLNVIFQNNTGLAIPLKIEAPIGTVVYGPQTVQPNANVDIPIIRHNCVSARLIVEYPNHGATQDFVLAPPGKGRRTFLETVEAQFAVGDITGSIKARTGDY